MAVRLHGHLTMRYYSGMFDDASWHFLHEIGYRMSMLREARIGWADVKQTIEYLKELNHGDLIFIEKSPGQRLTPIDRVSARPQAQ